MLEEEVLEITTGQFHLRLPLCVEAIEAAELMLKVLRKRLEKS